MPKVKLLTLQDRVNMHMGLRRFDPQTFEMRENPLDTSRVNSLSPNVGSETAPVETPKAPDDSGNVERS